MVVLKIFVWGPNIAGSWVDPANWTDAAGSPRRVAPGAFDAVTINASGGTTTILTGTGIPPLSRSAAQPCSMASS